jgi:hypothetical protein
MNANSSEKPAHRGRIWFVLIVGISLLVLAFLGYAVLYPIWYASSRHVHDPGDASSPADVARCTSVPPPPEARELRVAAFQYGQARLTFVRFSAPKEVCLKYAAAVIPSVPLTAISSEQQYDDVGAIDAGFRELHDLRWFDLPYANSFWTTQGTTVAFRRPSLEQIPSAPNIVAADANTQTSGYLTTGVRVDLLRGVFYFLQEN